MDQKLTESLQKWLATPKEQRDYEQGNIYLFRLCGNKIQYRNLAANPSRHAEFISRQIQKYVNFRVREFTHDQVKQMEAQVEKIVEKRLSLEESNPANDFKKGKRADHDSLPEEIQSLYVENLGITQRMRDVQTRLRLLSTEESPCPDSERYPFLQELIALDKKSMITGRDTTIMHRFLRKTMNPKLPGREIVHRRQNRTRKFSKKRLPSRAKKPNS